MRIALVDFVLDPNQPRTTGLSDIVWALAEHLAEHGDDVTIVAPYAAPPGTPKGITVRRFPIPVIGYRNIVGHLMITFAAARELRRWGRFDIVHAPEYLTTAMLGLLKWPDPVVLTSPGNIYNRIAHGNPFDWSTTQVLKVAARITARTASAVIPDSEGMARWWVRTGTPRSAVIVIPTGVDTRRFNPAAPPRPRASPGRSRIMYAHRLSIENGPHDMLRAFGKLTESGLQAELLMIGQGGEEPALRSLADRLGIAPQVTWLGWVPLYDLPPYYTSSDVFVAPNRSGVQPRVLTYAMACGTPVVGARIAGISDKIADGVTGLLAEPANPSSLADAVSRLLSDPARAKRMAHAALQQLETRFSWRAITGRIRQEIYEPLSRGEPRPEPGVHRASR